jgi:hypothetical protein
MMIDLTHELFPVIVGLDVALVVATVALVSGPVAALIAKAWRRASRVRFVSARPALAR